MEEVDMQSKQEFVNNAKGLARFFAVDITIKIFGVIIWEYHFPPKS